MSEVRSLKSIINPTERQEKAFAATLRKLFVLYGGAMGGGKSYFLRWWCIREAMRLHGKYGVTGVRLGLFSMDYPTLRDRQINRIAFEVPEWIGKARDSQIDGFSLVLRPEFGSGVIAFRNLDNPSKYNSAEFAGIAVEELTENAETIFHELRKRIRWPGIPQNDMHFVAAANPGGKGHAWVKKFWIDRMYPPELKQYAEEFEYVPALAQDNPHIDSAYYNNLMSLPEDMRKAYAEGSWDIFAGQYFTEWRKDLHVVGVHHIPRSWTVTRCGDWGESKPCAYLWIARSPEGALTVIREVYGAGMKVAEQAAKILAIERELERDGVTIEPKGILDSACWDTTGRIESIAEQFGRLGIQWNPASKGPGSRVAGWTRLKTLMHPPHVRLRVMECCPDLIRTLPALVHDKNKPEDVDSDGEDHAPDALRYGLERETANPVGHQNKEEQAMWAATFDRNHSAQGVGGAL
jgi:phage terminase large subunit